VKIWEFLAKMPAVNVKLAFAMLLAAATAVKVLAFNWEPTILWLGFVSAWDGIALGQYAIKRSTDIGYAKAKTEPVPEVVEPDPNKPRSVGGA
jgi:hypothetical protein